MIVFSKNLYLLATWHVYATPLYKCLTDPEQPYVHQMKSGTEDGGDAPCPRPAQPEHHSQVEHEREPVHHQVVDLRHAQE